MKNIKLKFKKILFEAIAFIVFLICAFALLHKDKKEESQVADSVYDNSQSENSYRRLERMTVEEFEKSQVGKIGDRIEYIGDTGIADNYAITVNGYKVTKELTDEYQKLIDLLGKNAFDRMISSGEVTFTDNKINEDYSFVEINWTQEMPQETCVQYKNTITLMQVDDNYNVVKPDYRFSELVVLPQENLTYVRGIDEISNEYAQGIVLKKGLNNLRYVAIVSDNIIQSDKLVCSHGSSKDASSFMIKLN